LQKKRVISLPFQNPLWVKIGRRYGDYVATERGTGECVGFEGELPEAVNVGDSYLYLHLSKGAGELLTVEIKDEEIETFIGQWIDPLTIKSSSL
jgi:hypothetical protein